MDTFLIDLLIMFLLALESFWKIKKINLNRSLNFFDVWRTLKNKENLKIEFRGKLV